MNKRFDIAVIGGGVVGLAILRRFAMSGLSCVLLEKGADILSGASKGNSAFESAYEITLNNAKKEKVIVTVQEPIGGEWSISAESQAHKKVNSHLAVWKVEVPAEGSATLSYRAAVKY